jgi:hypothetical protein
MLHYGNVWKIDDKGILLIEGMECDFILMTISLMV